MSNQPLETQIEERFNELRKKFENFAEKEKEVAARLAKSLAILEVKSAAGSLSDAEISDLNMTRAGLSILVARATQKTKDESTSFLLDVVEIITRIALGRLAG